MDGATIFCENDGIQGSERISVRGVVPRRTEKKLYEDLSVSPAMFGALEKPEVRQRDEDETKPGNPPGSAP